MPRSNPDVTVVVAGRDRREELVASIGRHEAPVILVDNASGDGSADAVAEVHPQVDVVRLPGNLGAAARTVGARRARTAYVAFADDDSWWAPGALAAGAAVMAANPRLALVNARIHVGPKQRLDPACAEMAASPLERGDLPGPRLLGFVACAALVRRDAFLAVGGFDDVVRFPGEEERVALDLAAGGWGLAYLDDLVVHHHPSPRREDDAARRARIVRSSLLTSVMRRPAGVVGERLRRAASGDGHDRAGLRAAVPQLPAAVRRRRVVPDEVERDLALLDGTRPRSHA